MNEENEGDEDAMMKVRQVEGGWETEEETEGTVAEDKV